MSNAAHTRATEPSKNRVDPQHPWPGLLAFQEADREFFFGRDGEAEELLALVVTHPVTVLFGLSGLGKTSLLGAGLFPQLRQRDFLPVHLRLDVHASDDPSSQVKTALGLACREASVDCPEPRPQESIWEYLHRGDVDFWSARNRLLTPVLVFDQFEEIFSRLPRDSVGAERRARIVETIADLVEGRVPADVKRALEKDPTGSANLMFDSHRYHVLISLREDYLPALEELVTEMPSIRRSRMRLTHMRGDMAAHAVLAAGTPAQIVTADVASGIVRFVGESAATSSRSDQSIEDMAIEPALLSVVCRELNEQRILAGAATITLRQLDTGEGILKKFFEDATKDAPEPLRIALEQRFITADGTREMVAYQTLAAVPGVADADIQRLIDRRILRTEHREGRRLLELTHDRLTPVVRENRIRREQQAAQQEARRQQTALEEARNARLFRRLTIGLAAVTVVLLAAIAFAVSQSFVARREALFALESQRRADMARTEALYSAGLARAQQREAEAATARATSLQKQAEDSARIQSQLALQARRASEEAERQRQSADQARDEALAQQRIIEQARLQAEGQRRDAEEARQRAVQLQQAADTAAADARRAAEDARTALAQYEQQRRDNAQLARENQEQTALVTALSSLVPPDSVPVPGNRPPPASTRGLRVRAQDVNGEPLEGPVSVRVSNFSNSRTVFSGEVPSTGVNFNIPAGGPYRLQVSKIGYQAVTQFVAIPPGDAAVKVVTATLPVDASRAVARFPAYDGLPAEVRRILQNSNAVERFQGRTGQELYDGLTMVERAGLLNVLALATAQRLPDSRSLASHMTGLTEIRANQVSTEVDASLRDTIKNAVVAATFKEVDGTLRRPPPGFQNAGSFKSSGASVALEVTFFASEDAPFRFRADLSVDALAGYNRVFQAARSDSTAAEHPFDVQQLLVFALKIDPLYRVSP